MLARFTSPLAALGLATGALFVAPARLNAQVNLTFNHGVYSAWAVGTEVTMILDLCAPSGFIAWQVTTIYFNTVDVTSQFALDDYAGTNCQNGGGIDGFVYTGEITIVNGPNDLRVVWSTSQGSGDETLVYKATYATLVTPDDSTAASQAAFTSGYTKVFVVKNWGSSSDTYKLRCVGSGAIVCDSTTSPTVTLSGGASANITAYYGVNAAGSGKLFLGAYGNAVSDSGSINITASAQAKGAPRTDPTVYNHDKQSVGACAQACFAATHAQSAVPYFSLSTPRTVTLVYNGDRLNPKPFVHVDVKRDTDTTARPAQWRLQVKVKGSLVTFVNGEQTLKFDTVHVNDYYQRIGGQFDASSYATGAYAMEIIVSAYYSAGGGSLITTVYTTKLVVVNETNSRIAAGWTLGGIQRLYYQTDGSALITEGDGSAVYFQRSMAGSPYAAPAGEFTGLMFGTSFPGGPGWTRSFVDSTKVMFDTLGRMTKVLDRFANAVTVSYTSTNSDSVWKVKDPLDTATVLSYGANGLASIAAKGRTTTVTVDGSRRLTAIKDPDNDSTRFGYDDSSRLSAVTDRRGDATTIVYDAWGRIDSVSAPTITVIQPNGSAATQAPTARYVGWQRFGVPQGTWITNDSVAKAVRADTVRATVRELGLGEFRFTVNRWGAPAQTTAPLGYQTTVLYDTTGLPIRVTNPAGDVDTIGYNSDGLPTYRKSRESGVVDSTSAIRMRYAGWGQVDSVWGFNRPVIRNVVGSYGRITSTAMGPSTTTFTYDSRGRVIKAVDAYGHLLDSVTFSSVNGNPIQSNRPGNRVTQWFYDAYGRDSAVKAPGSRTQRTIYDVLNRPIRFYNGVDSTADSTFYDDLLPARVSFKGQSHVFAYNALGWPIRRTDPAGKTDTLGYSVDGELRRWVNRRGHVTTYAYDALHRRLKTSGDSTPTDSLIYSSYGNVIVAANSVSVDSMFFGLKARVDSLKTLVASQSYVRRFSYRSNGLLDSVVIAGPVAFTLRKYRYDTTTFALDSIKLASSSTGLTHDNDGLVTGVILPGNVSFTRGYSTVHDFAGETSTASYATTTNRYSSYDKGDRLSRHILGDGATGHGFAYDSLGRLIKDTLLSYSSSPPNPCAGTQLYDENGNQCPWSGSWSNQGVTSYTYDSLNNRTDLGGSYGSANRVRQFDSCNYVTDSLGNGNILRRACGADTVRFHWTAESRLKAIKVVGGDSLEFSYDGAGRLVRRTANGTPRYYIWNGTELLAELNSDGSKVAEYSYYPGLDNPHAVIVGTTQYFAHSDAQGNVIALTDSLQNVSRTYSYTPWGVSVGGTDYASLGGADRARFKGALWMGPQVDVYYMRARWYETKTGRFLSEDPMGIAVAGNAYAFAGNDPVNMRDPTGLCPDGEELWVRFRRIDDDGDGTPDRVQILGYFCHQSGGYSTPGATPGETNRQVQPTECPVPPIRPSHANLGANIARFEAMRAAAAASDEGFFAAPMIFANSTARDAEYDYKMQNGQLRQEFSPFGNFNYGAMGRAAGLSANMLFRGAGFAELRDNGMPLLTALGLAFNGIYPYGDEEAAQADIRAGIQYYDNGCSVGP